MLDHKCNHETEISQMKTDISTMHTEINFIREDMDFMSDELRMIRESVERFTEKANNWVIGFLGASLLASITIAVSIVLAIKYK